MTLEALSGWMGVLRSGCGNWWSGPWDGSRKEAAREDPRPALRQLPSSRRHLLSDTCVDTAAHRRLHSSGELKRDLTTRGATEVYHGLEGILRDIDLKPFTQQWLHAECASEFIGRVAELLALRRGLVSTWTGSHVVEQRFSSGQLEALLAGTKLA
eukprot:2106800-Amphidinium_carterae.1